MSTVNSLRTLNRQSDDVSKSDLFKVSPGLLLEEENFNPRGAFIDDYFEQPEVVAHIRRLADSYKRGDYVPPIIVHVREGEIYVRDGHCRRRALNLAISEGADIRKVEVLELKGDEAAQTALILTSNDGLSLTPLERAVIYEKRIKWGWTEKEVANEFGRSEVHVRQLLEMMTLPLEMKQMIQRKRVSAYTALELFQEHGMDAVKLVMEASEKKEDVSSGSTKRVTKKDVSPKRPRLGKKMVTAMQTSLSGITNRLDSLTPSEDGEHYALLLSLDEVEELKKIRAKLEEHESGSDQDPSAEKKD